MEDLINVFEKKGYQVKCFKDSKAASDDLLKDIRIDDIVGIGGSVTILDMGLYEQLTNRGNTVYWHWKSEDKKETLANAKNADVYLSSVNAISKDGKIVNMDGTSNRVSSMIYGHRDVYLIVGKNKICNNLQEAIDRIYTVAAPKNAKRINAKTPCSFTGKCNDCSSPDRICCTEVIFHKKPNGSNIILYFIDEELGY
ncbi:MAG: LUD domain-containing protein [Tissierellia bacterium]|nr:LUD domain-containing protein [Tissierellia bacterium]